MSDKIIRCVGVAGERFDEDALRIMRAFRFSAQLDFSIEENTKIAASLRTENLKKISAERIRVELTKLLLSNHPDRLLWMQQSGITKVVLPEFDAMLATEQNNGNHLYNVGEHTLKVIEQVGRSGEWSKKELQILRFAALLHDVAKPGMQVTDGQGNHHFPNHAVAGAAKAKEVMRRLKFDNETTDFVVRLVAAHNQYIILSDSREENLAAMRHMMYRLGPDLMELLWELQRADVMSQHPAFLEHKLTALEATKQLHREVLKRGDCVSLKQLAVNGKDLIEMGAKPGKEIGEILEKLLEEVLNHPEKNKKEILMQQAENHI